MAFLVISSFLLFLCVNFAYPNKLCKSQNPCQCILHNDTIIDLSSVGSLEYPRFYAVSYMSDCSEFFSYNPCFAFNSPDKQAVPEFGQTPCIEASACIKGTGKTDGTPPAERAIGLQSTATFGVNGTIPYINYTSPKSNMTLQVLLLCNNSNVHELKMNDPSCSNEFDGIMVLSLYSKCACPNGCKSAIPPSSSSSGLSTGSKLLIAFFTIFLAYLLIGIVWNACNGAQGVELIPNLEFWNDLPTLIMEGVLFTCSCCKGRSSYGEV